MNAVYRSWGDYAATVVDPDDDATFWIAQEAVKTSGVDMSVWKTRIYKLGSARAEKSWLLFFLGD